jgi:hypothetical protein
MQESAGEENNSHRVSIHQSKGLLASYHRQRQHGRITSCQMRYLTMATTEATGGVLHRPKRSKHPVLHMLEKAIYTIENSRSFPPLRSSMSSRSSPERLYVTEKKQ